MLMSAALEIYCISLHCIQHNSIVIVTTNNGTLYLQLYADAQMQSFLDQTD